MVAEVIEISCTHLRRRLLLGSERTISPVRLLRWPFVQVIAGNIGRAGRASIGSLTRTIQKTLSAVFGDAVSSISSLPAAAGVSSASIGDSESAVGGSEP